MRGVHAREDLEAEQVRAYAISYAVVGVYG